MNAIDENGHTALCAAAIDGNLAAAKCLLAAGANRGELTYGERRVGSALAAAVEFGHIEIVR